MGMGDIFIQDQLIGLEKEEDYNDKENINDPFTPQYPEATESIILSRKDPKVIDFTIEARKQLYYEQEKRASKNGKIDSFRRKMGDVTNFTLINRDFPEAADNDEEGKKEDPYYTYPKQYSKGLSTYTEELVNTGDGYKWLVTRIQTKVQGGKDDISWKFTNVSNPKYD
jgi:hypothetical protein